MNSVENYFSYPFRRPGLDHDRYDHRYLANAPPVRWPGSAPIALNIVILAQHFPIDATDLPFLPVGGMERISPDLWNFSMRDYGNRVGIFRIMRVLDARGLTASVVMSSALAERYPALLAEILSRDWEILCGGVDMAHLHHGGLDPAREAEWVAQSFETLRRSSGQKVLGWHAPDHAQSEITLDLVAANGAAYSCDWLNDDMPYEMRTAYGSLVAMPMSLERSDKKILYMQNQSLIEWEQQIMAAFDCLRAEGERGAPRIMSLVLTPWVVGQPYRIQALARVLDYMLGRGALWAAQTDAIRRSWEAKPA